MGKLFALYDEGVIDFDESLEKMVRMQNRIYKRCDIRHAHIEQLGLNYHVITEGLVRRSDGTPCGNCDYCREHRLRCPHGINLNF